MYNKRQENVLIDGSIGAQNYTYHFWIHISALASRQLNNGTFYLSSTKSLLFCCIEKVISDNKKCLHLFGSKLQLTIKTNKSDIFPENSQTIKKYVQTSFTSRNTHVEHLIQIKWISLLHWNRQWSCKPKLTLSCFLLLGFISHRVILVPLKLLGVPMEEEWQNKQDLFWSSFKKSLKYIKSKLVIPKRAAKPIFSINGKRAQFCNDRSNTDNLFHAWPVVLR